MKQKWILYVNAFLIFSFLSCNNSKQKVQVAEKNDTEHAVHSGNETDCEDVHWSHHEGEDGPENWKNLCDGFSACGGMSQSPIDIVSMNVSKGENLMPPQFNYGKSKVEIINNSHTVQFNVTENNWVKLNGKDYQLLQFHYHALSEHTIEGKYSPLEVHFVHQYSESDYAVLGVMFIEGKENELFTKYMSSFPTEKGVFKSDDMFDILSLFPENKNYYQYSGSLTTPPCSEVVNWYVLQNPVEASKEQIQKISKILDNNYRPIMPINGREVKSYTE